MSHSNVLHRISSLGSRGGRGASCLGSSSRGGEEASCLEEEEEVVVSVGVFSVLAAVEKELAVLAAAE